MTNVPTLRIAPRNNGRPPVLGRHARGKVTDLSSLMAFVNIDDKNKADFLVPGDRLEFTDRKTIAVPSSEGTVEYSFTPYSFDQFAGLLDIPPKYLGSCPVSGKGSMKDQVEARMEKRRSDNFLVRVRNTKTEDGLQGTVRAILSSEYALFDNRHLVQAMQTAVKEIGGDFDLVGSNTADPRSVETQLHIRLVGEELTLPGDDPHRCGIHGITSEVGDAFVDINALVWRLVCSNGMMGWGDALVLHQVHKGFQSHEMTARVQEACLAATRQHEVVQDMLTAAMSINIENPVVYLETQARRMKLSDGFIEASQEALKIEAAAGEVTRFTIAQAFTRAAQALPLPDRSKIETKVGKFLYAALEVTMSEEPTVDFEAALITSIISRSDIRTALKHKITPEFFYNPLNKACYKFLIDYYKNPMYGDTPSWESFMHSFHDFEPIQIEDSTVALCDKVRENQLYSDTAAGISEIAQLANGDPFAAFKRLKELTAHLVSRHTIDDSATIMSMLDVLRDEYYSMKEGGTGLKGYPYPWEALNHATLGLQNGQLIFFYARPKSGKTWLLLLCAMMLHKIGLRPIIFSQELTNIEIARRFVALTTGVDYDAFNRGKLTEDQEAEFFENMALFAEQEPVIIDMLAERGEECLLEMEAKIDEHGANVALVDGVYLLGEDWKELGSITRGMKRLAKKKNIPILGATQQNRKKEDSSGSDVAYADSFLQDCDVLMKVKREAAQRKTKTAIVSIVAIREGVGSTFEVGMDLCRDMSQKRVIITDESEEGDNPEGEGGDGEPEEPKE